MPSLATEQCNSTTATATEVCEIDNPSNGIWWILVQNWAGSTSQPDHIDLLDAVIPSSGNGSLLPVGPDSVPAGQEFTIDIGWNVTGFSFLEGLPPASRFFFGAFSVAKDDVSAPINTIYVNLELAPDPTAIFLDGFESGDTSAWSNTVP